MAIVRSLRLYKEFVAILVFFVSGFLWLHTTFARKDELSREIKAPTAAIYKDLCLLQKNVEILNAQLHSKLLLDDILAIEAELRTLSLSNVRAGPDEIHTQIIRRKQIQVDISLKRLEESRENESRLLDHLRLDYCENTAGVDP